MTYTVLGSSQNPNAGVVIVATERMEPLKELLRSMDLDMKLADIRGSVSFIPYQFIDTNVIL